ncbi:M20 metallopeptidase family protein [Clostridium thermarum]|uniref:M20 metallopeptidase family protein n=1 Tax=Clostridium thermarum TaxID=1716543 RepID=UPI0013D743D8|nr:M20 family metallopeptidase [Clostridium thermarum]
MNLKELIKANLEPIKKIRETLHNNAELSHEEFKTQKIILDFLKDLDIPAEIYAVTGVAGILNSGEDCLAIRADMDALPVNGVSHACGHDYHMAIVLGTAYMLKKLGCDKCVKFIFQPAEETDGGALPMIKEGVLENPKVTELLGFHVWPGVKVGTIELTGGPSMASVDEFMVTFKGVGGHAAMPHLCKNPMYPAMDMIQSMNIKSRIENNPLESHVVTFSSIQAGTAANVIPEQCTVKGTVRTFNNELRNKLYEDIKNTASLSAEKFGCTVELDYKFEYPPLISDTTLTEKFAGITADLMGKDKVLPLTKTFAGEDFGFFAEKVPSVHFRLGIEDGDKGVHPLHSPYFSVSEECIFHGIHILTNYILKNN